MGHQVDRVGEQVGNYRLEQMLGSGGFAEVYLGRHVYLDSPAAIKLLHTNLAQGDIEGFRSEAVTLVRLIHPHIVRILDFGLEGNTPFLVMDYAPNGTLRQRYARGEQVPLTLVVDYVKQVAASLQFAHDQKIIHRDIKPENMLLGRRDEILLSDFGIAVVAQTTHAGLMYDTPGTITYMAPEHIQGQSRKASDQYSLGTVVYEWLTGYPPFTGSFTAVAAGHMFAVPSSLRDKVPTISPEVEQVVLMALAKDPKQRFESVLAFAIALEQASKGIKVEILTSDRAFPEVSFDTWRRCERCLPHVQMCVALIEQYGFAFAEAARLLDHAGWYLWERGIFEQAEQLLQRALTMREQTLGPEDPETAATLNHLANVARELGHFEQAEQFYQRALAIQERALGSEHPNIATTLYEMAYDYYMRGKYQQAEPLAQRALTIREKAFGSEHPLTADLLNDLANIYDAQGKYEQAQALLLRSLAILEHTHESPHPRIANNLYLLARVYDAQGDFEQATSSYQRALAIQQQSLGEEHPETRATLEHYAELRRKLEDREESGQ